MPFGLVSLPFDDPRPCLSPPICVSSRVEQIHKKCRGIVVDRQFPRSAALNAASMKSGEGDFLAGEPQQYLPDASEVGRFAECKTKDFGDPAIGIHFDLARFGPGETHRKAELKLPR